MRIAEHVDVLAPPEIVWKQVIDPSRVLDFFAGVTRWECVGGPRTGLGARYRMLMRVGSAEVGGLIEVVEFDAERDLAWNSVTGIDQRGRWRLRAPATAARGSSCGSSSGSPAVVIWSLAVGAAGGADRARQRQAHARAAQAGGRTRAGARRGRAAAAPHG